MPGLGVIGGKAPEGAPRLDQVRAGVADVHEHPAAAVPDRGGQRGAAHAVERFQHFPLRRGQGAGEQVARRVVFAGETALDDHADRVTTRPAAILHAAHAVGDHRRAGGGAAETGHP